MYLLVCFILQLILTSFGRRRRDTILIRALLLNRTTGAPVLGPFSRGPLIMFPLLIDRIEKNQLQLLECVFPMMGISEILNIVFTAAVGGHLMTLRLRNLTLPCITSLSPLP